MKEWERVAAQIVSNLHRLADDVERIAVKPDRNLKTLLPDYIRAAERVQHEIAWSLANIGSWRLLSLAVEADRAQTQETTP